MIGFRTIDAGLMQSMQDQLCRAVPLNPVPCGAGRQLGSVSFCNDEDQRP